MNTPQLWQNALTLASESGRLDLASLLLVAVSVILAVVAIGLIGFTFISYYSIKKRAEDIARETTEKIAREITNKVVNKIAAGLIAEKLPAMLREHLKDKDNYNSNVADNIAGTINEGEENG